jgi:hypothetical protein
MSDGSEKRDMRIVHIVRKSKAKIESPWLRKREADLGCDASPPLPVRPLVTVSLIPLNQSTDRMRVCETLLLLLLGQQTGKNGAGTDEHTIPDDEAHCLLIDWNSQTGPSGHREEASNQTRHEVLAKMTDSHSLYCFSMVFSNRATEQRTRGQFHFRFYDRFSRRRRLPDEVIYACTKMA